MNITYITAWDTKGDTFNGKKIHDHLKLYKEMLIYEAI